VRDLAGLTNMPPDALEATVARYNSFVKDGKDADYSRHPDRIAAVQTPPYYAMELAPSFINTQGGPRRNKDQAHRPNRVALNLVDKVHGLRMVLTALLGSVAAE
jgi:hypothetical protein